MVQVKSSEGRQNVQVGEEIRRALAPKFILGKGGVHFGERWNSFLGKGGVRFWGKVEFILGKGEIHLGKGEIHLGERWSSF